MGHLFLIDTLSASLLHHCVSGLSYSLWVTLPLKLLSFVKKLGGVFAGSFIITFFLFMCASLRDVRCSLPDKQRLVKQLEQFINLPQLLWQPMWLKILHCFSFNFCMLLCYIGKKVFEFYLQTFSKSLLTNVPSPVGRMPLQCSPYLILFYFSCLPPPSARVPL